MKTKPEVANLLRYLRIAFLVSLVGGSLWGFLEASLIIILKLADFQYVASHRLGGWEWVVQMAFPPTLFYGVLIYGAAASVFGCFWGLVLSPVFLSRRDPRAGRDELVAAYVASLAPFLLFVVFEITWKITTGRFWKFSLLHLQSLVPIVVFFLGGFLLFRPWRSLLLKLLEWKSARLITERKFLLPFMLGLYGTTLVLSFSPQAYFGIRDFWGKESTEPSLASEALPDAPNILMIVMDTTRRDRLSCYGYPRKTTPNLDQLAGEGILVEDATSTAPWTLPSHASLFTGTFPSKHLAHEENLFLDEQLGTMAELLASLGYQTVGFSNNPWISDAAGMSRGFRVFKQTWMKNKGMTEFIFSQIIQHYLPTRYDDGAKETNRWVIKWLQKESGSGQPFFMFINYMEAHMPNYPSPLYELYLKEPLSLETQARIRDVGRNEFTFVSEVAPLLESDFGVLNDLYDAEITYLDRKIGEILDYLRGQKILDDTVVMVLSDHGENIGDHRLIGHHLCVYDSLLRIPLIIRYPKVFPGGTILSKPVQICDIFPTLLDLLGVPDHPIKGEMQGRSFLDPSFRESAPRHTIAEYSYPFFQLKVIRNLNPKFDVSPFERRLVATRAGDHKYIWSSNGNDELYNLKEDPGEEKNIVREFPEKLHGLRSIVEEWVASTQPQESPGSPRIRKFDKYTEEQLRSLGYIQ